MKLVDIIKEIKQLSKKIIVQEVSGGYSEEGDEEDIGEIHWKLIKFLDIPVDKMNEIAYIFHSGEYTMYVSLYNNKDRKFIEDKLKEYNIPWKGTEDGDISIDPKYYEVIEI